MHFYCFNSLFSVIQPINLIQWMTPLNCATDIRAVNGWHSVGVTEYLQYCHRQAVGDWDYRVERDWSIWVWDQFTCNLKPKRFLAFRMIKNHLYISCEKIGILNTCYIFKMSLHVYVICWKEILWVLTMLLTNFQSEHITFTKEKQWRPHFVIIDLIIL